MMDIFGKKRIAQLEESLIYKERLIRIQQQGWNEAIGKVSTLKIEIAIHNKALARIISKLDPLFAGDEMSPERKAESDKITEAVMRKLIGEHLASRVPGDN